MRDFSEKELQKMCHELAAGAEREKESSTPKNQPRGEERGYDFTEEELEKARRERALRKQIEFEESEKNNRPGLIFTWAMLILEFYLIKEQCLVPPYDILKILFGVFMLIFFWCYHWGARR